jgi:hypothetical protein
MEFFCCRCEFQRGPQAGVPLVALKAAEPFQSPNGTVGISLPDRHIPIAAAGHRGTDVRESFGRIAQYFVQHHSALRIGTGLRDGMVAQFAGICFHLLANAIA